jgi:hypothetical protein
MENVFQYKPCRSVSEPDPMVDCILSRFLWAGWVDEYFFQSGRGYMIRWSIEGRQKAMLLQSLIEEKGLACPNKTKHFTWESLGVGAEEKSSADLGLCEFWRSCLEELRLGNEENALSVLVGVVMSCPSVSTRPRVLSGYMDEKPRSRRREEENQWWESGEARIR